MADDSSKTQQQNATPTSPAASGVEPPVPSQELINKVIAEQKRQVLSGMTVQQRAAQAAVPAAAQEPSVTSGPVPASAQVADVAAEQMRQMQQQMQLMRQQMQGGQESKGAQRSPRSGPVTPGNQFSQFGEEKKQDKLSVPWHPMRNSGVSVELEDCIIKNVPEGGVAAEVDPSAKVILALFSEILAIRELVDVPSDALAVMNSRIQSLESTLYEQGSELNTQARNARAVVEKLQSQGLTADDIISRLSD